MPTLVIPKSYADNRPPRVKDIDNIRLTLESFFNNTKVDHENLDLSALTSATSASQSRSIVDRSEIGASQSGTTVLTVSETGSYILCIQGDFSLTAINSGFPPSLDTSVSATATFIVAINGVNLFDRTLTAAASMPSVSGLGSLAPSIENKLCVVRTFTEGDVITSSGLSVEMELIKLIET